MGVIGVREELEVNGELELTAHCGDAAGNVRAVDGARIPCIYDDVDGGAGGLQGGAVIAGDGHSFVEVAEETFHADGFFFCFVCCLRRQASWSGL